MPRRTLRSALVGLLAGVLVVTGTLLTPAAAATPYVVGLTATTPVVTYEANATFVASVSSAGLPAAVVDVALYRVDAAGVRTFVDYALTDAGGNVTLTEYGSRTSGTFVAVAGYDEGTSPPVTLQVSYAVRALEEASSFYEPTIVSPAKIPPGGSIGVQGSVVPAGSTTPLVAEQRFGTGVWQTIGSVPVAADGSFAMPLGKRSKVGTWTIRLTHPGDNGLAAGVAEATTTVTVTGAGRAGAWRPVSGTRSSPARWGTCKIGYRVNYRNIPANGLAELREAMRRVTQVSGIRFRYLGKTSHVPYAGYTKAGTNKFTVAWASDKATQGLFWGAAAGVGGTSHTYNGRIFTGYLAMNTAWTKDAEPGFGAGTPHGLVLMHELGHVVGLGHSPDPKAIMASGSPLPASVWGAADITGLRKVGSRCR